MLQKLALGILFTVLAITLTACNPQDKTDAIASDKKKRTAQCLAQQSQCEFDLAGGKVQVLFDVDKITAEQSFNMVVNYHGAETLINISGYLEGGDMYMGKIPLFIEPRLSVNSIENKIAADVKQASKQVFQAEVLVGSCSAEQMTWRIWLTFTTSEHKAYSKMLTVVSYRS